MCVDNRKKKIVRKKKNNAVVVIGVTYYNVVRINICIMIMLY